MRREIRQADGIPARQRVGLGNGRHHAPYVQRLGGQEGMIGLHHHQPQLGFALQHIGDQAGQDRGVQAQQQFGMLLLETGHGARHQKLRQAGNGGQAQHARAMLGQRIGKVVDPLHHALGFLDFLKQAMHLRGWTKPPANPLEQRHGHAFLGLGQHPADRRLRNIQETGRTTDRSGHDDGPQHFGLTVVQFIQGVRSMPICYTLCRVLGNYCPIPGYRPLLRGGKRPQNL
ncbi:hypothetical protein D3C72_1429090 [compost metagenome]